MKKTQFVLIPTVAAALLVAGCSDTSESTSAGHDSGGHESGAVASTDEGGEAADIVATAMGADGFETLVAAVKAAGLVETLQGDGPFTVFAPTDEAFAALPEGTIDTLLKPENKDQLVAILTYHVVPGKVMASDVVELNSAKTVQGGEVAIVVDGGKVTVDGANVTATDINCSNGVIHVIDSVILPKG